MTQPSTDQMTLEEATESLTGFDEVAIEKLWGDDITTLLTTKVTRAMRAVVFVLKRREGLNDKEAHAAAMALTLGEVGEYFADEPDEVMPEDPETELGKGDSEPAEQLTSSLPSVS